MDEMELADELRENGFCLPSDDDIGEHLNEVEYINYVADLYGISPEVVIELMNE